MGLSDDYETLFTLNKTHKNPAHLSAEPGVADHSYVPMADLSSFANLKHSPARKKGKIRHSCGDIIS